jgi:hypothetical protein
VQQQVDELTKQIEEEEKRHKHPPKKLERPPPLSASDLKELEQEETDISKNLEQIKSSSKGGVGGTDVDTIDTSITLGPIPSQTVHDLSRALEKLKSSTQKPQRPSKTGARVNVQRYIRQQLAGVPEPEQTPFIKSHKEIGGVSGVLLIDRSGSMGCSHERLPDGKFKKDVAAQVGRIFASAVEELKGKSTVMLFCGENDYEENAVKIVNPRTHQEQWTEVRGKSLSHVETIKTPDMRPRDVHWAFNSGGGTIPSTAIQEGRDFLGNEKDTNLLIIITDGQPNPGDATRSIAEIQATIKQGIDVLTVILDHEKKATPWYKEMQAAHLEAIRIDVDHEDVEKVLPKYVTEWITQTAKERAKMKDSIRRRAL